MHHQVVGTQCLILDFCGETFRNQRFQIQIWTLVSTV